jgi:hypothetical protein
VDFFLFLLVNATLFIRPAEIVPDLENWPIYNMVIVANLIIAAPAIADYLSKNGLSRCPTTTCVLGVLVFVVMSHLARFDTWYARTCGTEFSKIVAYFFLLIVTVNSTKRFFTFLAAIVAFTLVVNTLTVLEYNGLVDFPTISVAMEGDYNEITGELFQVPRMRATGIFGDPNDLSMIIVTSMILCACALFYPPLGLIRQALLAPLAFLGYALTLTQSRGGLLALLVGCGVLLYSRFGIFKAGILSAVVMPAALVAVGGRQANLGSGIHGGTGQERAEYWSNGLVVFKQFPLFGVGQGMFPEYNDRRAAHNSFVEAFTELGFFGGMLFLGMFVVVGWSLWRLHRAKSEITDAGLRHALPFVLALLVAFGTSMMSLSRAYVAPTYLSVGIGVAYLRLAQAGTAVRPLEFSPRLLAGLASAQAGFIAFIYFYIKLLYRMG